MLKMYQINEIIELKKSGNKVSEIIKITGADRKTINKYLTEEDYSPDPPVKTTYPSKLDSFKPTIDSWLEQDKTMWYKQRHTAKRVYDRIKSECRYTGSYNLVQRYMKQVFEADRVKHSLELTWEPGTAQADFGEADFEINSFKTRMKYLTVSFPYSNNGFSQVFGGETAECVCQGLKDIFCYIGGVPSQIIFDNATGIGRRIGDKVHESDMFSRFRAHYKFSARFCNPYSGNEKGNVERKVGYTRANMFVPMPKITSMDEYNEKLLSEYKLKASEPHYRKEITISELFESDKKVLLCLPAKAFNVCRYEWLKADGYGKISLDGNHFYSTCPENSGRKVLTGIRAHTVDVLKDSGEILCVHKRMYGEARTDAGDSSTILCELMKKSGAWMNSSVRSEVPDQLREYMDSQDKPGLKSSLRMMNELTAQYGYRTAVQAMNMAAQRGKINICDTSVIASRISGYGIDTPPQTGPPLDVYDEFLKSQANKTDGKNA